MALSEGFMAVRRLVLGDVSLQQELRQAPDQESLFRIVVALGRDRGYEISEQDLEDAVRMHTRAWLERWLD
ncbi:MAG TPA: Nif11-like leader peptide family natural product precursor [Bryobacteraceae bacterium]|nr:Nif11-like leader peptide family natural product precursor [Bryobacteraceae bacterium]